jgi:hypothetical protein
MILIGITEPTGASPMGGELYDGGRIDGWLAEGGWYEG